LDRLPAYAVGEIAKRKRELLASGVDVIDLGAGDPDIAPPTPAVDALRAVAGDPAMSRYAFQTGWEPLRQAIAAYMARRFAVQVDAWTEVLPLVGSKEGLAHLAMALLDQGDAAAFPEPGYPAYGGGVTLAGGVPHAIPLREDEGFLVPTSALHPDNRIRLLYLNYPNNPTGATANRRYLEEIVSHCREHGIVLAYDNAYAEITFDDYKAPSILEFPGARDVAVEFHSFSKSFGMTGWRLGWAVGNSSLIGALSKVKTFVDTGAFLAIQHAGATMLEHAHQYLAPMRNWLVERRDALVDELEGAGWPELRVPKATMYLWARLPEGMPSFQFAKAALDHFGVAVVPGAALGGAGEGYIRMSFIQDPDRMREAARRLVRALHETGVTAERAV
jgi:LL-diaminopimelate aminotransferase